jgi:hypothetical protein
MSDHFSDDVHKFIIDHVNSVEQLETLLLLRGDASRVWTAEEVSQALYTPLAAATMRLSDLQARGLLVSEGDAWRYQAASAELDRLVGELAQIYRDRRVTVITLIYSKPHQQVQAFANAFKLRKDP